MQSRSDASLLLRLFVSPRIHSSDASGVDFASCTSAEFTPHLVSVCPGRNSINVCMEYIFSLVFLFVPSELSRGDDNGWDLSSCESTSRGPLWNTAQGRRRWLDEFYYRDLVDLRKEGGNPYENLFAFSLWVLLCADLREMVCGFLHCDIELNCLDWKRIGFSTTKVQRANVPNTEQSAIQYCMNRDSVSTRQLDWQNLFSFFQLHTHNIAFCFRKWCNPLTYQ